MLSNGTSQAGTVTPNMRSARNGWRYFRCTEYVIQFADDRWNQEKGRFVPYKTIGKETGLKRLDKDYNPDCLNFLFLDSAQLDMCQEVLNVFPDAKIYVPNKCAYLIKNPFPNSIVLLECSLCELVQEFSDMRVTGCRIPQFSMIWYDACSNIGNEDYICN